MSISIIIPVYNVEKYLRQCLDSVLLDNHFTGEVICVNDGSTDGSRALLELYKEQYKNLTIIDQPNSGLSVARNTGLEKATGDYVLFIDSDDWLIKDQLQNLFGRIDGEDVIYFNAIKFFEQTGEFASDLHLLEINKVSGQEYYEIAQTAHRNMPAVCVCGGIYKRNFLLENNLWNEPGIYHEDEYFTPQVMLKAKSVSSVDICLYAYRIRSGSITSALDAKHIKDMLFIVRNLIKIYNSNKNIKFVFYNCVSSSYADIICNAYDNNFQLEKWWNRGDSKCFLYGAINEHYRRMAKISFLSTKWAYLYHKNQLPSIIRRMINKYL